MDDIEEDEDVCARSGKRVINAKFLVLLLIVFVICREHPRIILVFLSFAAAVFLISIDLVVLCCILRLSLFVLSQWHLWQPSAFQGSGTFATQKPPLITRLALAIPEDISSCGPVSTLYDRWHELPIKVC